MEFPQVTAIKAFFSSIKVLFVIGLVVLLGFIILAGSCHKKPEPPRVEVITTPPPVATVIQEVVKNNDQAVQNVQENEKKTDAVVQEVKKTTAKKVEVIKKDTQKSDDQKDKEIATAQIESLQGLYDQFYGPQAPPPAG